MSGPTVSATWSSHSLYMPAWTKTGASCQASRQPWSSSQSDTSSSRSEASSGSSCGALATISAARCCSSISGSSLAGSNLPPAIILSLPRIPATRSRRLGVAPPARGGGCFRPGVRPRGGGAEGEQPLPLADRLGGLLVAEEQALQQVDRHRE